MYSAYSFATSALDGGEWSASRLGHGLTPGKGPLVPIVQEADRTSISRSSSPWADTILTELPGLRDNGTAVFNHVECSASV
jgi:hypothetical protein